MCPDMGTDPPRRVKNAFCDFIKVSPSIESECSAKFDEAKHCLGHNGPQSDIFPPQQLQLLLSKIPGPRLRWWRMQRRVFREALF